MRLTAESSCERRLQTPCALDLRRSPPLRPSYLPGFLVETPDNERKAAYRSFARKYELARANLRRKTALLKVLESRLDKREDALHDLHERSQEKVMEVLLSRS